MARVLIIAYGNPLRSDDGVAWRAADLLERNFPESEVEILRLHQLAPELADAARNRDLILFLDAACPDAAENTQTGQIRVKEISQRSRDEDQASQCSHVYSPARILNLARKLYHEVPKAFVLTIAGETFDHGDLLSDPVEAATPDLVAKVEQIVQEYLSNKRRPS